MIRPALLAASLALVPALAIAQPRTTPAPDSVGGPSVTRSYTCQPGPGRVSGRFAQRPGSHTGWSWMDLHLSTSDRTPPFTRVTRQGQVMWQGFIAPGEPVNVTLGIGDGQTANATIAGQTTVACHRSGPPA